jgi:hypothetical protein
MLGEVPLRPGRFPLLLKFLDTSDLLSVQVHPADRQTQYLPAGDTGKTEAWVVLEAGPQSVVYAGNDASAALGRGEPLTPSALEELNKAILQQLALADQSQLAAYQLGRALRDTCYLPNKASGADYFLDQFSRDRLAVLQGWLSQASGDLPDQAGNVVGRSINSWQAWADVNARRLNLPRSWSRKNSTVDSKVVAALRQQSHPWRDLLTGDMAVPSNPSTEAWILAGQSVLMSVGRLTWQVVRRFWFIAVVVWPWSPACCCSPSTRLRGPPRCGPAWSRWPGVSASAAPACGRGPRGHRAPSNNRSRDQEISSAGCQSVGRDLVAVLPQGPIRRYRLGAQCIALPDTGRRLENRKAKPAKAPRKPRRNAGNGEEEEGAVENQDQALLWGTHTKASTGWSGGSERSMMLIRPSRPQSSRRQPSGS